MDTTNLFLNVSDTILEATPGRALDFLKGVGRSPVIYGLLANAGYTEEEHARGWKLLLDATGAPSAIGASAGSAPTAAAQATMDLDAWDEPGMARIDAALESRFPEQHAFVFADGLGASTGAQAVVGVERLLTRLAALEGGKGRPKASHKADRAALELLEARGITKSRRNRLATLVAQAQTVEPPTPAPEVATPRRDALVALLAWYRDWAKTAKAVVSMRAHLITLGLAKRRARKDVADPVTPSPEPAPMPAPTPVPVASSSGLASRRLRRRRRPLDDRGAMDGGAGHRRRRSCRFRARSTTKKQTPARETKDHAGDYWRSSVRTFTSNTPEADVLRRDEDCRTSGSHCSSGTRWRRSGRREGRRGRSRRPSRSGSRTRR